MIREDLRRAQGASIVGTQSVTWTRPWYSFKEPRRFAPSHTKHGTWKPPCQPAPCRARVVRGALVGIAAVVARLDPDRVVPI